MSLAGTRGKVAVISIIYQTNEKYRLYKCLLAALELLRFSMSLLSRLKISPIVGTLIAAPNCLDSAGETIPCFQAEFVIKRSD